MDKRLATKNHTCEKRIMMRNNWRKNDGVKFMRFEESWRTHEKIGIIAHKLVMNEELELLVLQKMLLPFLGFSNNLLQYAQFWFGEGSSPNAVLFALIMQMQSPWFHPDIDIVLLIILLNWYTLSTWYLFIKIHFSLILVSRYLAMVKCFCNGIMVTMQRTKIWAFLD